ncbi:Cbp1 family collagen-binding glycoprotein adhesin [Prevotella sp. HCN-7019]|uniref:Cbp1 family collagen-binding glycoprotein adhesin n=1 Tax=Prevotella sp. HCN-7019 TaxID=3134668 RepID=UPI0030BD9322
MKKLLFLAIGLTLITFMGCKDDRKVADVAGFSQNDSLQKIIAQKDNEINDIMETFNQIEAGFKEINEAENRVSLMKDGEGASRRQQLVENVQFISATMKENRALIDKLRRQLRESSVKSDNLKKTIENLVAELEEKDNQLQQLRAELDAKNIHIAELDQTISGLNDNVSNLKTESSQKSATIQAQDKQLNTAWFVFGTKKELKEQRIIDGDRVLESNFNKSYFTKIDIRVEKEIKLYSKYAKILTMHPSDSYTLQKDANKQYVLRITNPQIFWSTSKYLVILVK